MVEATGGATGARAELQTQLLAKAEEHLGKKDTYNLVKDDKKTGMKIWQTELDGSFLTVSEYEAELVSVKAMKWYSDNDTTTVHKCNSNVTLEKLEEEDGTDIMYQHIKTPIIFANRAMIYAKYYNGSTPEGKLIRLGSDKGNEALYEKYAAKIGKDVQAATHLVYQLIENTDKGAKITQVLHIDLGGSLPQMIQNKIASEQALGIIKTTDWVRKNYIPQ